MPFVSVFAECLKWIIEGERANRLRRMGGAEVEQTG